jgi:hypothetical protein
MTYTKCSNIDVRSNILKWRILISFGMNYCTPMRNLIRISSKCTWQDCMQMHRFGILIATRWRIFSVLHHSVCDVRTYHESDLCQRIHRYSKCEPQILDNTHAPEIPSIRNLLGPHPSPRNETLIDETPDVIWRHSNTDNNEGKNRATCHHQQYPVPPQLSEHNVDNNKVQQCEICRSQNARFHPPNPLSVNAMVWRKIATQWCETLQDTVCCVNKTLTILLVLIITFLVVSQVSQDLHETQT